MRILHNAARRAGRKGRGWTFFPFDRLGRGQADPQAITVAEMVEGRQEVAELRRLIAAMPGKHREAIVLRYYAALTEPEVAQVLGVPAGTVKSRLHSARQWLLTRLTSEQSGDRRDDFVLRG